MSLSESLQISTFIPEQDIVPRDVIYLEYENRGTAEKMRFDIKPPSPRSLLDSEVWIKHTIKVRETLVLHDVINILGEVFTPREFDTLQTAVIALRQGFVTHSAITNINCYINGTKINETPRAWVDHVMRYYITKKENETAVTLSGGKIDENVNLWFTNSGMSMLGAISGNPSSIEAGIGPFDPKITIAGVESQLRSALLPSKEFINPGFDYRWTEMWKNSREGFDEANESRQFIDDSNTFTTTFDISVWERLPVSPFMLWETKDKKNMIPHIDVMLVEIDYAQSKLSNFFGGWEAVIVDEEEDVRFESNMTAELGRNSIIRCKWITPPLNLTIPKTVSIPMCQFRVFEKNLGKLGKSPDNYVSVIFFANFDNIRLEQIPDKFFIYITPPKGRRKFQDPSEHCLQIVSLRIKINGDPGKIVRIATEQLYMLYTKNMKGDIMPDWRSWSRYFCTAVLKPEDIGLKEKTGPGSGVSAIISIEAAFRVWYTWPNAKVSITRTYRENSRQIWPSHLSNETAEEEETVFHVACEYKKYKLEMTQGKPSKYVLFASK